MSEQDLTLRNLRAIKNRLSIALERLTKLEEKMANDKRTRGKVRKGTNRRNSSRGVRK